MKRCVITFAISLLTIASTPHLLAQQGSNLLDAPQLSPTSDEYQYPETRELVQLVNDAAELLRTKGQALNW